VVEKTHEKGAEESGETVLEFYRPNYMTLMLSGHCVLPVDKKSLANGKCHASPTGAHWWVVAAPGQPSSRGCCRYCGTERVFWNTIEQIKRGEY